MIHISVGKSLSSLRQVMDGESSGWQLVYLAIGITHYSSYQMQFQITLIENTNKQGWWWVLGSAYISTSGPSIT